MLTTAEIKQCSLDTALIGKRGKKARKEKHQTQEYLAGLCDCTPTHICNIENGKIGISLELLFKISAILEKSIQSVRDAMPGVDYIFHAAALKQVPSCEFFPMEAVRTNVEGTDNVLHAAIEAGVKRVVCLSTDKAAYPINAMGISKAMMEHVIYANARVAAERGNTVICCTRYGNVMCSRGSVIPLFIDQIRAGSPITITDPNMTRFLMNLDEAVELVKFAFEHANPGDLFIQKADASTIGDLAKAVQQLFGDTGANIIGTRHGEKLYETLMTREERLRSEDMGDYYRVAADNRDLNYDKYFVRRQVETEAEEAYTSHNTTRLNVAGTVKKILTTDYVQKQLSVARGAT